MEFATHSAEETRKLGQNLAKDLKGKTVALYGELGAGKTHFIQGVAEGLGIKKRVLSPTFIFIRPYEEENFYHIDLYRLENSKEAAGLGLEEILDEKGATIMIEWPEKIQEILTNPVEIRFEKVDENTRRIKLVD